MKWQEGGQLMRIGWTASEHLMCVQDDGVAIMYDIFGNVEKKFDMGEVCDHFIYLVIAEDIILSTRHPHFEVASELFKIYFCYSA